MIDSLRQDSTDWLSLREASEKMGVSFATLRAWADEGRVESYRTPGGHRRFRVGAATIPFRQETKKTDTRWRLLEHSALGQVQLLQEATDAARVVLTPQARAEQRELERALIRLCTDALRGQGKADRRAEDLGEAYGKWNWRFGIGTRAMFQIFGLLRRAYSQSVVEFAFGVDELNADDLNLWLCRVNEIIDLVLVSMLEYRSEETGTNGGKK